MPQQQETGAQQQPGSQSGSGGGDQKQQAKQNGGGGDDQQPIKLTEVEQLQMDQVGGAKAIAKKIEQQSEKLCQDIQLVGSNYSWRGVCKKCGWQTMQFDKNQAHALVKRHALKHWRELVGVGETAGQGQDPSGGQMPGQQAGQQPPQAHPQQSAQPQQRQQPAR